MNERIRELAQTCWQERKYGPAWFDEEQFAQLIVSECIELVKLRQRFAVEDRLNAEHALDILVYDIEQHFEITHE